MHFPLPVTVSMTVGVILSFGLRRAVTAEVVMIMPMRWGCYHRSRNPTLFADLRLLGRLVIVFIPSPLGMGNESLQRRLVHVA